MTEQTLPINDIGTDLRVTITESGAVVDISAAAATAIIFVKPDGSTLEVVADKLTDGTDGILNYQTAAGVIDQIGQWAYRGKVTFSASLVFHTVDPDTFTVIK